MHIKDLLKEFKDKAPEEIKKFERSERSEIVKKFVEKLNLDRKVAGYKPIRAGYYAVKMAELGLKNTSDLYWFYSYCEHSRNFSKTWWWALRAK